MEKRQLLRGKSADEVTYQWLQRDPTTVHIARVYLDNPLSIFGLGVRNLDLHDRVSTTHLSDEMWYISGGLRQEFKFHGQIDIWHLRRSSNSEMW